MNKKKHSKAREWVGLVSLTGAGQALVQGLALISGFLVIQLISPQQYALYTLAYATLGAITALADSGIASGVMATGARDWKDRGALGGVLAAGMGLRRMFFAVALAVALPVLAYLLLKNGAGWPTTVLIMLALVPAFYAALTDDLLEIPLKLNQDIKRLQKNQVMTNLVRVIALLGSLFVVPLAVVAILANGLPRIWGNFRLRRAIAPYADAKAQADEQARREIMGIARKSLPGALYYAASGQITIWLVSIFGSTVAIAQVGALGRVSAILAVVGGVFSTLIVPRFARLPTDAGVLLSRFAWAMAAALAVSFVASLAVYLYPTQVLLVLGKDYAGLGREVFLSVLGGCVWMMVGLLYSFCASRGWILPFVINVTTSIAVQAGLIAVMELSTPANVMLYSLYNAIWGFVMYLGYFLFRIHKLRGERKE